MKETKRKIIMMRVDGVPVNVRYEPVKRLSMAARFNDLDEYESFITGYYKPLNASDYIPVLIEITYEVIEDVQQVGDNHEPS